MKPRHLDVLAAAAIVTSVAATLLVYDQLPERIATHFDIHGRPDGWSGRAFGAWFAPVFSVGLWAVLRNASRIIPPVGQTRVPPAVMAGLGAMITWFMTAIHLVVLRLALHPETQRGIALTGVLSLFWIGFGLVMPRLRRNAVAGIRTPWALGSEENWALTHRFGGYTMTGSGVLGLIVLAAAGPGVNALAFALLMAGAFLPVVYSFVLARRATRAGG